MICPKCGNQCDEDQIFCERCGTKLKAPKMDETSMKSQDISSKSQSDDIDIKSDSESFDERALKKDNAYRSSNSNLENQDKIEGMRESESQYAVKYGKHGTEQLDVDNINKANRNYEESNKKSVSEPGKSKYKSQSGQTEEENKTGEALNHSGQNDDKKNASNSKNKINKKKVIIVVAIAVAAVLAAVLITFFVRRSIMTDKFEEYYAQGTDFYDVGNYKDARTRYISASNNAFTKDQKLQSYEMVYKTDDIIGGYSEEEIAYLEALINLDPSNIEYYQALIVLYQNNDQDARVDALIASAPRNMQEELKDFDGTIPTANLSEGTYDKPVTVELSASEGVTIYYTTDGTPVSDSETKEKYTSPIRLESEGIYTLRALSVDENGQESKEISVKYVLDFSSVNQPKVTPDSGKYTSSQKIKVTADEGCSIYYTTDGSIPTAKSKKYKKSIKMPKGDSLYYFVAIDSEGVRSNVTTRAYEYSPEYTYDYDSALSRLADELVSQGIFENKYGEFSNGNTSYFGYEQTLDIDDSTYYIIVCETEDIQGANVSTKYYAVDCATGACYQAKAKDDSYELTLL